MDGFRGFLEAIAARSEEDCECGNCNGRTVSAHYGITDKDYEQMVKDMFCDMVQISNKVKILDKWFSLDICKTPDVVRVRALAFSQAMGMLRKQAE